MPRSTVVIPIGGCPAIACPFYGNVACMCELRILSSYPYPHIRILGGVSFSPPLRARTNRRCEEIAEGVAREATIEEKIE